MVDPVLYSSQDHGHQTPGYIFDPLRLKYGIDFDAAASADDALCPSYIEDALNVSWGDFGSVGWCNPPYGRALPGFLTKAHEEVPSVVMLLPSRTDTVWFQDLLHPYATEVWALKRRVKFAGHKHSAPFPSIVALYRCGDGEFPLDGVRIK